MYPHIGIAPCPCVSFTPPGFEHGLCSDALSDEETAVPVTSKLCQWNAPRKRKESNLPISEAAFRKHIYRRERKHNLKPLEDFDARPVDLRGDANDRLKLFLSKVRGDGLGVSLLLDEECRCWSSGSKQSLPPELPTKEELQKRVALFKESLNLPPHEIREIEQSTRDQSQSPLWHTVRKYRITASHFGAVFQRKPTTPPQALVLQIIDAKPFTSPATEWGKEYESIAREKYTQLQNDSGHHSLYSCQSGFVISEKYPHLGASPDAVVHDPSVDNPFGLAEIKCPYSFRNQTPFQAAESERFCCTLEKSNDTQYLKLKRSHNYFCQVQGQMAITERMWCDFVIYTEKGMSIERIQFDLDFGTRICCQS